MDQLIRKLNLGCGARAIRGWTNLDFQGQPGLVSAHDLRQALPYPAGHFGIVYHSHVLEHFSREDAAKLMQECHRVLQEGGILRVAVPDLESKAKLYVEKLAVAVQQPGARTQAEHEWMVIETIDQMVRTTSGGAMLDYLSNCPADDLAAVRIGDEFNRARSMPRLPPPANPPVEWRERLRRLARKLGGVTAEEWNWIRFRRHGECHLWMYDRVSLRDLLTRTGFVDCRVEDANTSRIPDWTTDGLWLDVEKGIPRKPDSLFMEAVKLSVR